MGKKSSEKTWLRFPESFKGVQVNFCKFPTCPNFGAETEEVSDSILCKNTHIKLSERQVANLDTKYSISGSELGKGMLSCKACKSRKLNGEITPYLYSLKSNIATMEECERIGKYLLPQSPKCINDDCLSNTDPTVDFSFKKRGKTAAGSQRYQCKICGCTFTDSDGSRPQKRSEINRLFFELLVGKMPFRRIAHVLRIDPKTVYSKIDFLHRQCLKFAASKEVQLLEGKFDFERLYLATDRQIHLSNWISRDDKRNTEIYGVGTACLNTSYVFAFNFNFDESLTQDEVERLAKTAGDLEKPSYHRQFARVWLNQEYELAAKNSKKPKKTITSTPITLVDEIQQATRQQAEQNQSLASEHIDETTKLPPKGVLIHNEYTMLGHFFFLKELFKHCSKTRFYMDLDSGLRNAYLTAFKNEIKEERSEGFMVKSAKDKTSHEKDRLRQVSLKLYKTLTGKNYSELSPEERKAVELQLIKNAMQSLELIDGSTLRWLTYPIATKPEPEKKVAAVTNIARLNEDHQANLYRKASLHAIDRFFMKIRRLVCIFERPIKTPSNANRVWHGYSPYNLSMYTKLGDIFRVYYNYCDANEKNETPAMRLGLSKNPVPLERIIYFGKYK